MIFETNISDYYKVVQSSDECCYKYILGKLQEAKEIYIMAFGKSQRNIQLMDSLKSLKGKITVISDIDTIKGENIKRINKINSSFNLDKNSKIIMTERGTQHDSKKTYINCSNYVHDSFCRDLCIFLYCI